MREAEKELRDVLRRIARERVPTSAVVAPRRGARIARERVLYQRGRGPNTARCPDRTATTKLIRSHSSRFNKRLGRTIDLAPSTAFRGMNVETLAIYFPVLIWR